MTTIQNDDELYFFILSAFLLMAFRDSVLVAKTAPLAASYVTGYSAYYY
jgi:hypothetical protein